MTVQPSTGIVPPFIGFATLEDWIAAIDSTKPVYAMKVAEPRPMESGLTVDELVVICQQVADDLSVKYIRLRAASVTMCYGEPFDTDFFERQDAWNCLGFIVDELLKDAGLTIQRAIIARPKNFTVLEGKSNRIRFDPETKRYVRVI